MRGLPWSSECVQYRVSSERYNWNTQDSLLCYCIITARYKLFDQIRSTETPIIFLPCMAAEWKNMIVFLKAKPRSTFKGKSKSYFERSNFEFGIIICSSIGPKEFFISPVSVHFPSCIVTDTQAFQEFLWKIQPLEMFGFWSIPRFPICGGVNIKYIYHHRYLWFVYLS